VCTHLAHIHPSCSTQDLQLAFHASGERWNSNWNICNPFHNPAGIDGANALPDPAHLRGRHMRSAPPFLVSGATSAAASRAPASASAIASGGNQKHFPLGGAFRCRTSGCSFFGTAAKSWYCSECWIVRSAIVPVMTASATSASAAAPSTEPRGVRD
jgi:hypothetical protein